jgi:ribosomal protein S14
MAEKKFRHVCECKNCGNEAEMMVTCTLADAVAASAEPRVVPREKAKAKGHAVCTRCGGEADIWLDV